jgi:hypothetical protein
MRREQNDEINRREFEGNKQNERTKQHTFPVPRLSGFGCESAGAHPIK